MIDVTFRPLAFWDGERTFQRSSPFRSGWGQTLELLDRELRHLSASNVVIEIALRAGDIRLDGWPRGDARTPEHPGVILSFDSEHGPLRYQTGVFTTWQDNIRAIALGLEALRKVDRYGISRRGEQYRGWRQLPSGPIDSDTSMGRDEAVRVLSEHTPRGLPDLPKRDLYRAALKATHPDHGGDREDFERVQRAGRALEVAS